MENNKVLIEKFDGKDFGFWKMQIEDYLYQRNLYQPLEGKKPESMTAEEWKLMDRQALGLIRLTLARTVAFNVKDVETTAGLMKTLSDMYEKPTAVNKVYLMRRLFDLKMIDGTSVAEHINEFNAIIGQLSSVKLDFDDEVRALILLSSLPGSWETVVATISNSMGKEKLTLDGVRDLILSEGIRRRETEQSGVVYSSDGRGRGNQRARGRSGKSKSRGGEDMGSDRGVVCWSCGDRGHVKKECPNPRVRGGDHNGRGSSSRAVNSASVDDDEVYDGDVLVLSIGSQKFEHTELGEMHEQRMDRLTLGSGSGGGVRNRVTFMDAGDEKSGKVHEGGGGRSPI